MDRLPEHLQHGLRTEQSIEMDSTRIRAELGYCEPVPRPEAIRRTVEWELENPPSPLPPPIDYSSEELAMDTE